MRRKFWMVLGLGLLLCLAIGIYWTARLDIPSPKPWWYGKETVVRVEVWEPGRDMATFGMTMPKKTLDTMYAMGMKSAISMEGRRLRLADFWKELQRLPKGEKLTFEEDGAKVYLWIEEKGAPRDTAGTPGS